MSKKKKKEKDEEGKKPKGAAKSRVPASDPVAKPKLRTRSKATAPRKPKATAAAAKIGFSREEIALRAYFIAEDRHRHGKPGSASDDWHEAERQLRAEAGAPASGKTL